MQRPIADQSSLVCSPEHVSSIPISILQFTKNVTEGELERMQELVDRENHCVILPSKYNMIAAQLVWLPEQGQANPYSSRNGRQRASVVTSMSEDLLTADGS